MGRDHSITCDRCGTNYGGMNGPDECECSPLRPGDFLLSRANHAAYAEAFKKPTPWMWQEDRIAALESRLIALEETLGRAGLVADRRVDDRRMSSTTPRPSARGKGRRK